MKDPSARSFTLRSPQPGDLGWIVQRHGEIYGQERGWDQRFEGLVASIVGQFVEHYDAERERCWIAELEGRNVGSICAVRKTDELAQLRLLLVEPAARGLGLGRRLVGECLNFARSVGYRRMTLVTTADLSAARYLYEAFDFEKVRSEPVHCWGVDVIEEIWERDL